MKRRNQFTLVELLVVIGIIVILAGMLMAGLGGILGRGEDAEAKSDMTVLRNAIAAFEMEYNRLPKPKGYDGTALDDDQYTWLIQVLQGEDPDDKATYGNPNRKKKQFLSVKGNSADEYLDPWDNRYQVVFEKEYKQGIYNDDGNIKIPGLYAEKISIHSHDHRVIYQNVVIWSKGKDGEQVDGFTGKKNEDNVYSVETSWGKLGHAIQK